MGDEMTRISIILGAVLLLAACSQTTSFNKVGVSSAQRDQDWKQCDYEATAATPQSRGDAIAAGVSDGLRIVSLRKQCMESFQRELPPICLGAQQDR